MHRFWMLTLLVAGLWAMGAAPAGATLILRTQDQGSLELEQARMSRDAGDFPRAIALLSDLHQQYPTDAELGRLLAETFAWDGQLRRARALYRELAAGGDSLSLLGVGLTYAWEGDLYLAGREYAALESSGLHREALLGLARVRFWAGRAGQAEPLLARAESLGVHGREPKELREELDAALAPALFLGGRYLTDTDASSYALTSVGVEVPGHSGPTLGFQLGRGVAQRSGDSFRLTRVLASGAQDFAEAWRVRGWAGADARTDSGRSLGGSDTRALFGASVGFDDTRTSVLLVGSSEWLSENPRVVRGGARARILDLGMRYRPCVWWQAEGGAAHTWFSDDRARNSWFLATRARAQLGPVLPGLGFAHRAFHMDPAGSDYYFSPERYRSDEIEGSLEGSLLQRHVHYFLRAGAGWQKVADQPTDHTASWKADVDFHATRRFTLTVSAGHSDAATQSASGYASDRLEFKLRSAF